MGRIFKGIRFRLTLVYSTLFGLFICVFAYMLSNQYFNSDREDFDSGLLNYAIDLSEYIALDKNKDKLVFVIPKSEVKKDFPFILNQTFYSVRSISGEVLSQSSPLFPFKEIPYNPVLPLSEDYTHRFLNFTTAKNEHFRALNLKITGPKGGKLILQVATSSNEIQVREKNHIIMTSMMVPILIIISSLASYFIAGNALSPIKQLIDAANRIAAQNLSLRVPEVNTGDEVDELSKTLNHLLNRMEASFKAQENFVANASHQLNTPLSIIKGELEILESKARSIEDYKRFNQSLREELNRLIDLVKNMLLLSRVKSGLESFVFNPVRLDDLLLTITSRLNLKAREKKMTIRFNISEDLMSPEILGEKQLLDCMFENLLENAIKYGPEESTVKLDMTNKDGLLEISIADQGPGIKDQDIQNFSSHRFRRGPSDIPGSGIGLPLAYKIAEFHKAQISYVKLQPQGSLFIIRFAKQIS